MNKNRGLIKRNCLNNSRDVLSDTRGIKKSYDRALKDIKETQIHKKIMREILEEKPIEDIDEIVDEIVDESESENENESESENENENESESENENENESEQSENSSSESDSDNDADQFTEKYNELLDAIDPDILNEIKDDIDDAFEEIKETKNEYNSTQDMINEMKKIIVVKLGDYKDKLETKLKNIQKRNGNKDKQELINTHKTYKDLDELKDEVQKTIEKLKKK